MARNNKRKPLPPPAMTIQEASEFWDHHSLLEFEGTEVADVTFKLKRKQYVGIDLKAFKKLNAFAKSKKTSPEALLELWINKKANVAKYQSSNRKSQTNLK